MIDKVIRGTWLCRPLLTTRLEDEVYIHTAQSRHWIFLVSVLNLSVSATCMIFSFGGRGGGDFLCKLVLDSITFRLLSFCLSWHDLPSLLRVKDQLSIHLSFCLFSFSFFFLLSAVPPSVSGLSLLSFLCLALFFFLSFLNTFFTVTKHFVDRIVHASV